MLSWGEVGDDAEPTICGWECAPSPRLCRRRHWEHPPPAANGHQWPRRTASVIPGRARRARCIGTRGSHLNLAGRTHGSRRRRRLDQARSHPPRLGQVGVAADRAASHVRCSPEDVLGGQVSAALGPCLTALHSFKWGPIAPGAQLERSTARIIGTVTPGAKKTRATKERARNPVAVKGCVRGRASSGWTPDGPSHLPSPGRVAPLVAASARC